MTVNRTTIALTQGLDRPLVEPSGGGLARATGPRTLLLLGALLAILAMVAT